MFIYFILLICFYMLFFFFLFFKIFFVFFFFFSSRRRHTRYIGDWSSHVCSSDLRDAPVRPRARGTPPAAPAGGRHVVPSARGGRGDPQCAVRNRTSRRRARRVRDPPRSAVRSRRDRKSVV